MKEKGDNATLVGLADCNWSSWEEWSQNCLPHFRDVGSGGSYCAYRDIIRYIKLNETFDMKQRDSIYGQKYIWRDMQRYDDYKSRFNLDHKNLMESSKYPWPLKTKVYYIFQLKNSENADYRLIALFSNQKKSTKKFVNSTM